MNQIGIAVVSLVTGIVIGMFTMAMCFMAGKEDKSREQEEK
jgi:uncharacterized membrane-anchored protein YhcB (DUF1043 family)